MATSQSGTSAPPQPNTLNAGPVAFIKSHRTVLFKQKVRACQVTALTPRGHPMVCDTAVSRTGIGHLLHAMVEQRPDGVRVIFWRIVGQKARTPHEGMSVADAAKPIGPRVRAKKPKVKVAPASTETAPATTA